MSLTKPGQIALILLLASAASAFGLEDYRTRIAVIPMRNATSDARYDSVCQTVTQTIALGLRLLGTYLVADSGDDPALLSPDTSSLEAIAALAAASRYDEVLFGEAARSAEGGPLTFRLSLFNAKDGKVKFETTSEASSILEVFDASDEITVDLLSQLSGIHIGFGAIEVKNLSLKGAYTVYLNSNRIRNPKSELQKVLNGHYTVSIHQDRLLGDTVIFEQAIDVYEDKSTGVSFSIPPATPQETAYLEQQKKKVIDAAADPANIDGLLKEIASFQQLSRKADYDQTLATIQAETLSEAGAQATSMLQQAMKEADSSYYGRKPDFKAARERYQTLSRLVGDVFQYRLLDAGDESRLAEPTEVARSADGTVFVLDASSGPSLRLADASGKIVRTVSLGENAPMGSLATDAASNLYYADPSNANLLLFDRSLARLKDIAIPGFTPDPESGITIAVSAEGIIYVVAGATPRVFEPGKDREKEIEAGIEEGLKKSGISSISSLFFDADGLLNAFGTKEGKLVRFDALGTLQSQVTLPGSEERSHAAVDGLGYFFVTQPRGCTVMKYTPKGEPVASFGKYGVNPGEFSVPLGIAAAPDGSLLVADAYNNRVQILTLASPPVLLPEVAQFGMRFSKREETADKAQQRLDIVREGMKADRVLWPAAGALALTATAAGATAVGGYFLGTALNAYTLYQTETDPHGVFDLRQQVSRNWLYSQIADIGVSFALFGAAAFLTSSLLTGGDYAVTQSEAISQAQALSLDSDYEFDKTRYKALATAESIGFWTGVFPPLASLIAGVGTSIFVDVPAWTSTWVPIIFSAGVVIPPFWSHLYAGKFHAGLLISGLIADAAAAASVYMGWSRNAQGWTASELDPSAPQQTGLYPYLNGAWKLFQNGLPTYLAAAAIGIRLAAGIYDTSRGWLEAKDNNLYKAIKKKAPEVSFEIVPGSRQTDIAIAISLHY